MQNVLLFSLKLLFQVKDISWQRKVLNIFSSPQLTFLTSQKKRKKLAHLKLHWKKTVVKIKELPYFFRNRETLSLLWKKWINMITKIFKNKLFTWSSVSIWSLTSLTPSPDPSPPSLISSNSVAPSPAALSSSSGGEQYPWNELKCLTFNLEVFP